MPITIFLPSPNSTRSGPLTGQARLDSNFASMEVGLPAVFVFVLQLHKADKDATHLYARESGRSDGDEMPTSDVIMERNLDTGRLVGALFAWLYTHSHGAGIGTNSQIVMPSATTSAPRALLLLLLSLFVTTHAAAQPYFDAPWRAFEATPRELIAEGLTCVAAGDLDGDGLPDVAAGQIGIRPPGQPAGVEGIYVFINQGVGAGTPATFAEAVFYETLHDPQDLVLVDLDGDGDLDIAAAACIQEFQGSGGNVALLLNGGDGTFGQAAYLDVGPEGPLGIAAADFDADGDHDLAVTNYGDVGLGTTASVFLNQGDATFAPRVAYPLGADEPNEIAAGDLDGDGDTDLAVAHDEPARVSVLFNDGSGAFGSATAHTGLFENYAGGESSTVVLFDPDNDGDLDAAYTSTLAEHPGPDCQLALLRNDGTGALTLEHYPYGQPYGRNQALDLVVADLNGDGFDDLLGAQYFQTAFLVFSNDGAGGFLAARSVSSVGDIPGVAAADLDVDGDPDVVSINRFYPVVGAHENPGDGRFDVRPVFGSAFVHSVLDLGDVNHDGEIDAVTSHSGAVSSTVNVYLGGGDGTFTLSYETPGTIYGFAQLADVNGDGDLDLLFVSGPGAPPYDFFTAEGNGDGSFGPVVRWAVGTCGSAHAGAFDLDGDGDLDVVNTEDRGCFGEFFKFLYVSRNNGDGTFQPPYTLPLERVTHNVTAGDFDEDGDLDLVTGHPSWTLLLGHGDGSFEPEQPLPGLGVRGHVLDLDGDGHLDLATLSSSGDPTDGLMFLAVLWGDGAGGFTATAHGHFPLAYFSGLWVSAGDVDGDGDLDVIADGLQDAIVMINEGSRSFRHDGHYGIGRSSRYVHYADTDGDEIGDLIALVNLGDDFGGLYDGLAVVPGLAMGPTTSAPLPVPAPAATLPLSPLAPNPAADQVAFTLTLASAQAVRIEAFDTIGRRVAILHDGPLAAGMAHAFLFNGAELPSGMYVVRAVGETFRASRRAVFVR
jgi:hypothetical protein